MQPCSHGREEQRRAGLDCPAEELGPASTGSWDPWGFLSWEVEAVFFFFFKPVQAGWEPGWLDSKEGSLSTPSLRYSLPTLHCASIPDRDHGMLVY